MRQEMQWHHQLDHMQTICTSFQTDNLITQFLQAGRSSWCPNNSVKAPQAPSIHMNATETIHLNGICTISTTTCSCWFSNCRDWTKMNWIKLAVHKVSSMNSLEEPFIKLVQFSSIQFSHRNVNTPLMKEQGLMSILKNSRQFLRSN